MLKITNNIQDIDHCRCNVTVRNNLSAISSICRISAIKVEGVGAKNSECSS
ncbi:hypothetical protein LSH36_518g02004 [Paralvinella palmiformis]|uniref:Uncharacterized protein n=1 Tax=Paralvinella palmiformis TaxID=53620 RepID=A0AAD9J7U4_9ANNE|nr:hypothetical protein LSH36_518g02004 [Paralvinella palmiformis]